MLIPNITTKKLDHHELLLLNTALTLYIRVGIQNITLSHIIKSSGLSRGQMYQFYESKNDLNSAMLLANEMEFSENLDYFKQNPDKENFLSYYINYKLYNVDKYNIFYDIELSLSVEENQNSRYIDWVNLKTNNLARLELLLFSEISDPVLARNKLLLFLSIIHGAGQLSKTSYLVNNLKEQQEFREFITKQIEIFI